MEDSGIMFKGNKQGITIFLDHTLKFDQLIVNLEKKMDEAKEFFGGASAGVLLKGRELSEAEEDAITFLIKQKMNLDVKYITTEKFLDLRDHHDEDKDKKDYDNTLFYHATLRSGQVLKYEGSIVIFGDVNPGAEVISGGNLVVVGRLKGIAQAGCKNPNAYIIAFDMNPMQLRIADVIARSPDEEASDERIEKPHKARLVHNKIYIEPIEGTFNI